MITCYHSSVKEKIKLPGEEIMVDNCVVREDLPDDFKGVHPTPSSRHYHQGMEGECAKQRDSRGPPWLGHGGKSVEGISPEGPDHAGTFSDGKNQLRFIFRAKGSL